MDCAEEVSLLRSRLSREKGVRELHFDTFQARMTVAFDPRFTTQRRLEEAVRDTGMDCEEWGDGKALPPPAKIRRFSALSTWTSGLALLGGLLLQVQQSGELVATLLAHGHSSAGHTHHTPPAALALYALAVAAGLLRIAPKAWASLRHGRPDMNLLVTASAIGAAGLGEWIEAASLAFLFSLAGRLESWSLGKARAAIVGLLQVTPTRATVLTGGHEHESAVANVHAGAHVRVQPGARFPFDGTVVAGRSLVDQALITGESVPVPKQAGAWVWAGTLNLEQSLVMETATEARDTVLARLIRMVESSTHRKARSEQWIERFARYYTPAVLALAITALLLGPTLYQISWPQAAYAAMMVLLVACPCALVISTPMTMMAAIASAARNGALIKGGAFLEQAAALRMLVTPIEVTAPAGVEVVRIAPAANADQRLQQTREWTLREPRIAYLGSGVEDLAALQAAALGVSLAGASSDATQEAADIVLMNGGSAGLDFLVGHARRAVRLVGQNIGIALGLKLLFVAAALSGRASLWMAVASDMGATLLVTLNALRMLRADAPAGAREPVPASKQA